MAKEVNVNSEQRAAGSEHSTVRLQQLENIGVIALALLLAIAGIALSIAKAPFSFGFGDHTLFHAFGHWISHGEVFTRDFIHFRTPGPYYYYGLMQYILGDEFKSTSLALLSEAHVAQTLAGYCLALALSKAFYGKKSLTLAFLTGVIFLILPPIFQLRTALPAISLAIYILTLSGDSAHLKKLIATGAILGISFWFGQELFVFLSASILAAEASLIAHKDRITPIKRIVLIAAGTALTIVPIVIYFFLAGTDLKELFYNTLYYAFFIQPKGMDTPFPPLNTQNFIFYAWLIVYVFAIFTFTLSKKIATPAAIVFFSFVGMRMISMLGRADTLHLLFSISELVILLPISLWMCTSQLSKAKVRDYFIAVSTAAVFSIILYIAVKGKASVLLSTPLILLTLKFFCYKSGVPSDAMSQGKNTKLVFANILGFIAVIALTYPLSTDSLKSNLASFTRKPKDLTLGVELSPTNRAEFDAVKQEIEKRDVKNIFSYPIHTEFYALVDQHATRFVEFAPQTTQADVDGAISDLRKSRPPLVIRDLDQVSFLSPILHDLSDYVQSNYTPVKILQISHHFEILVRKQAEDGSKRLFDNVYTYNLDHNHVTAGLRNDVSGEAILVIAVNQGNAIFKLADTVSNRLTLSVFPEPGGSRTGIVEISRDGITSERTISVDDGRVDVPVPSGSGELLISLKNAQPGSSVLWQDPILHN